MLGPEQRAGRVNVDLYRAAFAEVGAVEAFSVSCLKATAT
jgi:hypothetical protein